MLEGLTDSIGGMIVLAIGGFFLTMFLIGAAFSIAGQLFQALMQGLMIAVMSIFALLFAGIGRLLSLVFETITLPRGARSSNRPDSAGDLANADAREASRAGRYRLLDFSFRRD